MDRKIRIDVNGSYIKKDNNTAGVMGEGNSTKLNIIFDESWDGYAKSITFYNARGLNPTEIVLTTDLLTDILTSTLDYMVAIPSEALEFGGEMAFVIDGYVDNERQRSATATLAVRFSETSRAPGSITPTQAEQLQGEIDSLLGDIQAERILAQEAAETATSAVEEVESASGTAIEAAETATNAANVASEAATGATASKESAEESAEEAKYWAEQAEAIAGGDYVTIEVFETAMSDVEGDISEVTDNLEANSYGFAYHDNVVKLIDTKIEAAFANIANAEEVCF